MGLQVTIKQTLALNLRTRYKHYAYSTLKMCTALSRKVYCVFGEMLLEIWQFFWYNQLAIIKVYHPRFYLKKHHYLKLNQVQIRGSLCNIDSLKISESHPQYTIVLQCVCPRQYCIESHIAKTLL